MSTIRADSVTPSAGGTSRNLPRGVAAAWANLNGSGVIAGRDSVNITSYTDNGTGDYSFNLTAAMSNANYGYTSTGSGTTGSISFCGMASDYAAGPTPTASVLRLVSVTFGTAAKTDTAGNCMSVFGSLA